MKVRYKNISEEYFKSIDVMKKDMSNNSISGADRIRKEAKAIILADKIQNISDDSLYDSIYMQQRENARMTAIFSKVKSSLSNIDYRVPYHMSLGYDIENSIKILRSNSSIEINFLYEINIDHIDGTRAIAELTQYTSQEIREAEPFSSKTNGNSFLYNLEGLVERSHEIDYVAACKERLDEIKEPRKSFQRSNYYIDIRPLVKFLLTNEVKRRIKESVDNLKSWLTTIYADSDFPKGIPFILNLYIKSLGNNDSYLVYSSERGFDKYYDYTPIVNESYIKTVDKMKAAAEKSTYNADEIRKHAKKVIISDIVKNCDLKSIYEILLSIFRRNQHTSYAASQRVFKILSSDYIESEYFDCRLVNCFWTIDEDINNLITKTDTSVKIVLIYAGEMKIVREYDINNTITGFNGTIYKQPVRPDSHWLNPEVEDMQADVNYLRKHLEFLFPGIPFDIEVDMQYREGHGFDWVKKHVTLVRSCSDIDECIKKYKEVNNL